MSAMLFSGAKDLQQSNKQADPQQNFPKINVVHSLTVSEKKTLVSAMFSSEAKELCH